MKQLTPLELLAPAKDLATGRAAIIHGADAVYIGADGFGARAAAGNSVEDIAELVKFAHSFHARVYVTVNTLIFNNELQQVRDLVTQLYYAGVDALIVQDLALLDMDIPPIQLHASTQADARTPEKAQFLQQAGFSQIVLPREMTLDEIREVATRVSVPLEVFVHGALCVCYSGACRVSYALCGRSANRGTCAQICRQKFNLTDKDENILIRGKHLLSLKDMNRIASLEELAMAGASSFKIEGRLKDIAYVKNVTAAYRKALDSVIAAHPDRFCRGSLGISEPAFIPRPEESFNRGFTSYFLTDPRDKDIASIHTPKSLGTEVGSVTSATPSKISARLSATIANGDGLGFFAKDGEFIGFRANRVENGYIFPHRQLEKLPQRGTTLFRNLNLRFAAMLEREDSASRYIPLKAVLRRVSPETIALDLRCEAGEVTATIYAPHQAAVKPQSAESRRNQLYRLGATRFRLEEFTDAVPADSFIPNSILAALRRRGVELLDTLIEARRPLLMRGKGFITQEAARTQTGENVANDIARRFYQNNGIPVKPAAEVEYSGMAVPVGATVMECRYCLRRELGACLRIRSQASRLPDPLFLTTGNSRLRLSFDCRNCRMKVIKA